MRPKHGNLTNDREWAQALRPFALAVRRKQAERSFAEAPPWPPFNQQNKSLAVAIPNALADRIEAICRERNISRSDYMRELICADLGVTP